MGLEYGKQCKKEIEDAISAFHLIGALSLAPGYREGHPGLRHTLWAFLTYRSKSDRLRSLAEKYEEVIREYHPAMVEEMRGIAEGAQVNYKDIVYLNIFPEIIEGCSTWVACGNATRSGEPLLGMNTDAFKSVRKTQIVLFAEPEDGYKYIGTALAGVVTPHHGINQEGLAVAYMSLLAEKSEIRAVGIPAYVLESKIFSKCAEVEEALREFEAVSLSSAPSAIFLSDKERTARVEMALCEYDAKVIENGAEGCCMRPSLEKIRKYESTFKIMPQMTVNAIPRTKRMEQLLKRHYGNIDVSVMKEIARDHGEGETKGKGICQHSKFPIGAVTIGSFIAKPRDLRIWLCHGNPCEHEYEEFTL